MLAKGHISGRVTTNHTNGRGIEGGGGIERANILDWFLLKILYLSCYVEIIT
jgi:hypothetical protein